jgi:NAD(P)-dependent dehydrogenase (short-subunit alcohol dehydrogenase family)
MEPHSLQGKVVAVTGGASGIGLAIVRKLIALKAKVAVADVQDCPQELTDTTDVMFTKVDVSSRTAVHKWVQAIIGSFGRLDGMCANAGISPPEGEVASDDLFQKIFDVCCVGVWNCATEAYFQFKKQGGGGAIVTTASIGAFRYGKGLTAYGGAKSAVIGFTKGWAVEWAPHNIRVNCVAPGTLSFFPI